MKSHYYPKTFSDSEKSEIIRSFKQAENQKEQISILAELNACDTASIITVLHEAGLVEVQNINKPASTVKLKSTRMTWTDENISKLLSLKAENKKYREIADYFGISTTQVANALHRYGNTSGICVETKSVEQPKIKSTECTCEAEGCCESAESKYTLMDRSIINPLKSDISEIKTRLSDLLEFNFDNATLSDVYKLGIDMGQLYNIVKRAEERLADVN